MSPPGTSATDDKATLRRPPAWIWLTASALFTYQVLYVCWLIVKPGGEEALLWFSDTAFLIGPAVATVLLFLAAQHSADRETRLAWRLLGGCILLWTIGETIVCFSELILDMELPYPSVADAAYLAAYPFAFAGLLLFPRAPAGGLRRLRLSLDTLIAMVAIATFSCYFVIGELIASSSGESLLADAVNVTYPLADLGLIFSVLVLMGRPGPRYLNLPLALLAAGFAATAVADSVFTYAVDISGYASGDFLEIGWVVGYSVIAGAGLATCVLAKPATDESSTIERGTSPLRSLIPYALAIPLAALLIASQFADKPASFHYLVAAGSTLALSLIVARQVLSIYENAALNRALAFRTDELQVLLKETQQIARRDQLTGLPNRLALMEDIEAEIGRARRYGHHVGLALFDVDGFKKFNDTFGHVEGDQLLRAIAQAMQRAVRQTDRLYRYGGDEFILVMPETEPDDVASVVERLRGAATKAPCAVWGKTAPKFAISVSAGMTTFPAGGSDVDGLIRTADQGLYAAKIGRRPRRAASRAANAGAASA